MKAGLKAVKISSDYCTLMAPFIPTNTSPALPHTPAPHEAAGSKHGRIWDQKAPLFERSEFGRFPQIPSTAEARPKGLRRWGVGDGWAVILKCCHEILEPIGSIKVRFIAPMTLAPTTLNAF